MLDAYLDESGIHDGASACVLAGYFGGRGRWKDFEADWMRMLSRFQVPMQEFHAKSLYPKPTGYFKHEWKGDHQEFLEAITTTIARHNKIHPICAGLSIDDFNTFSHEERRFFTGAGVNQNSKLTTSGAPSKPYFFLFQTCVISISHYTSKGSKAHFFFGLGRPFAEYATALFAQILNSKPQDSKLRKELLLLDWKDRLGTLSFPLAKQTPQLQAADFFANLTYHHVLAAGENIEFAQPNPLLSRCIQNARSRQDFSFFTKYNLQVQLQVAYEVSQRAVKG